MDLARKITAEIKPLRTESKIIGNLEIIINQLLESQGIQTVGVVTEILKPITYLYC
jgi:hypothetical protein